MNDVNRIFAALARSGRDLLRPAILFEALWPPVAASVLWLIVGGLVWEPASTLLTEWLPDWSAARWFARVELGLAQLMLILLFLPLVYLTTLLFLSAFAIPRMMGRVAARDYPDLARYGSPAAALWGSLLNGLGASLVYLLAWLVCLPLVWLPGVLPTVAVLLTGWLNARTFRFDALAEHATSAERRTLFSRRRWSFFALGLVGAFLALLPFFNLLAPAYTALAFIHFALSALRVLRRGEGVVL